MTVVPVGRLRYVWREPEGRARVDLRGGHVLLAASPLLVRNRVTRTEIGGEAELRVIGPIALRATARTATIESSSDANSRRTIGGRVAVPVRFAGELTAGWQRMTYARASTVGYFAPRLAETAELGAYRESESESGLTVALDLGAGVQRVADWGVAASGWSPAVRGWAALGVPLAPGRELRLEAEAYDARIGTEVAAAGSRWRYGSLSIGVRWSLR